MKSGQNICFPDTINFIVESISLARFTDCVSLEKLRYRWWHDRYWARCYISRPRFEPLRPAPHLPLAVDYFLPFHFLKMKASSLFGIILSLVVTASAVPQGIQHNNRADNADADPQTSTSWYKFKSLYLVNLHHHQLLTRTLSRRDSQTMAKVR